MYRARQAGRDDESAELARAPDDRDRLALAFDQVRAEAKSQRFARLKRLAEAKCTAREGAEAAFDELQREIAYARARVRVSDAETRSPTARRRR